MTTIPTTKGDVKLLAPTADLMRAICSLLPFGVMRFATPQHGAVYGLVMRCGARELDGIKQQPVDCDEQQGIVSYEANSILIARSLAGYLTHGFSGLFMPCAYIRKKNPGNVKSGIAYFGYPSAQGREAQEFSDGAYDGHFGHGFTTMMTSFIRTLQQSSRDTGITLSPTIGLDIRVRSQIGSLGFGFMLVGRHIVCLKTAISPDDFVWAILHSAGITEVFHVPSVPLTIEEADLDRAKSGKNLFHSIE